MKKSNDPTVAHAIVSIGRSSVACRCGWGATRTELCDTQQEDCEELRRIHAQHVIRKAKEDA